MHFRGRHRRKTFLNFRLIKSYVHVSVSWKTPRSTGLKTALRASVRRVLGQEPANNNPVVINPVAANPVAANTAVAAL